MVQIIRHDRGLDHSRIEKILEMITSKISDIKYDRRDVLDKRKKELKEEAIKLFNLQEHYDEIKKYDDEIEKLQEQINAIKKKKEPHKVAIAKYMRGSDDTYYYDSVRDGSPVDEYISTRIPDMNTIRKNLKELEEQVEEKLWLAKDIEEAREIYYYAMKQIDEIGTIEKTN